VLKEFSLKNPDFKDPLAVNYFDNRAEWLLLLVGGSGDNKNKFNGLIAQLQKKDFKANFITYTPRAVIENSSHPLKQDINDLCEVLHFALTNFEFCEFDLFATSRGAFSTSFALKDPFYAAIIRKVLFFDPADFYLHQAQLEDGGFNWDGPKVYSPNRSTAADQLKQISGPVRVDVLHLTLRNYTKNGYVPEAERGSDHKKGFPRLNTRMVKTFYSNLPETNRGKYLELPGIPHAFMRDGNIEKNIVKVAEQIIACFC
jgi:hypothetical protein